MQRSIYQDIAEEDLEEEDEEYGSYDGFPSANAGDARDYLTPRDLALWRWANIENLDLFLRNVYDYYLGKGFFCIALSRLFHMLTVLFVIVFSSYLYSCVDYSKLYKATSLEDIKRPYCLASMSFSHRLMLWVFGILWVLKLFQYLNTMSKLWELHDFFKYLLEVDDNEIQTISWPAIVDKIVRIKASNLSTNNMKLDAHSIVNRIMRKENYMIGLYNKNILDLTIDLPLQGKQYFFTKTLEWCIDMCLSDYIFNEKGVIRPLVLQLDKQEELAAGLKRRFQFAAVLSVLLAPFAVFYTFLYFFFRYFNDYKSDPKNLGTRQYTPLAEWRFRELNELYHLFRRRISMSYAPAQYYISLFPREKTNIVIRFVIFVCSSFAAVLGLVSIYDPEFLKVELFPDQSVLFYLTTLGLAIAIARAMLANQQDQAIFQPETAMHQIAEFTHYLPENWETRLHSEYVKQQFVELYDMKLKIIARELLSILINPIILGIKLANCSETVVDYFREFSINVESYGGYVCSLAVFNTTKIEKVKARSDALDQYYTSQEGKMLKSYINFMNVYAPNANLTNANQMNANQMNASLANASLANASLANASLNASLANASYADPSYDYGTDSIMETYGRVTESVLSPVPEEDSSDDDRVNEGVLGLLNNLYHK